MLQLRLNRRLKVHILLFGDMTDFLLARVMTCYDVLENCVI